MLKHYALSELLIVLSALWCALRLWQESMRRSSFACLLIGLAAALGAYRFGVGSTLELAIVHRSVSQIGGAIAMALFALEFWRLSVVSLSATKATSIVCLLVLATLTISFFWPASASLIFVFWAIAAAVFVARSSFASAWSRAICALIVAAVLINVLVIRQASWLSQAQSWHAFHSLMALWLVAVTLVLIRFAAHKNAFAERN